LKAEKEKKKKEAMEKKKLQPEETKEEEIPKIQTQNDVVKLPGLDALSNGDSPALSNTNAKKKVKF
jgi:hypothetical protein